MPDAASDDENAVAAPISTAAALSASKLTAASCPVAFTFDMACSKSAAVFMAYPNPSAAAPPIFISPPESVSTLARLDDRVLPNPSTAALACPIFAWKSEI